jgi:hypothetical protein
MMVLSWLVGCLMSPCPIGLERNESGMCIPVPEAKSDGPLTPDRFFERFEDDRCDAMRDCACEELDPFWGCEGVEVQCGTLDWDWTEGCVFDELAAGACIAQQWGCELDGDSVTAIAPYACQDVWLCD